VIALVLRGAAAKERAFVLPGAIPGSSNRPKPGATQCEQTAKKRIEQIPVSGKIAAKEATKQEIAENEKKKAILGRPKRRKEISRSKTRLLNAIKKIFPALRTSGTNWRLSRSRVRVLVGPQFFTS